MKEITPIRLSPAFKDYIWGGRRLVTDYNKKCELDIVAESWELSTHKDGESVVADGEFKGLRLSEYIAENGRDSLGKNAERFEFFPMLIKLIDAREFLSVQVHPDDTYALAHTGEYGKTEMWYILDCKEDAYLYYGFERECTKEEFCQAIENNTLIDLLHKERVKKGDVLFIEAGTVHAIGAGMVICEIQQNSNSTYRVYDYGRLGKDGKPRQLHIAEALEVARTTPPQMHERQGSILASCDNFTVEEIKVDKYARISISRDSFRAIIVAEGVAELTIGDHTAELVKGECIFIPAQDGELEIRGDATLIVSYI